MKDLYKYVIRKINQTEPPALLKERYMLESRAMIMRPHHFLYEVYDRKILQFIEAGIFELITRRWYEENNPRRFEEYQEPFAVLTLGELEAGFVICTAPLALSVLVFIFEWVSFIFTKFFRVERTDSTSQSLSDV